MRLRERAIEDPRRGTLPALVGAAGLALVVGMAVALDARLMALAFALAALPLVFRDWELVLHVLAAGIFVESVDLIGPVSLGRVLAVFGLGAVGIRAVFTDWRPLRLPGWAWVPAALFGTWALASGLWARDLGPWSFAMGQLGLAAGFFLPFALFLRSADHVDRVLRTFAVGALVAGLIGLLQSAGGGRAVGLQGDPNLFALSQVLAVPALLRVARQARAGALAWRLAVLPVAGSVLLSQSRGGLFALLAVSSLVLFRRDEVFFPRRHRRLALAVAMPIALALASFTGAGVSERLDPETIATDRASGRIDIWHVAWQSSLREPLLGLGGGNFKSHSIELLQSEPGVELQLSHHFFLLEDGIEVHNVYLETLAEYGIPGAALYLLTLGVAALALRELRQGPGGAVAGALSGMLAGYAVATLFLSTVNGKGLWMVLGATAALGGSASSLSGRRP